MIETFIEEGISTLVRAGIARSDDIQGCSEDEIRCLEETLRISPLPASYRRFLAAMGRSAGGFFQGTDMFWPQILSLREYAEELLQESGSPFQLPDSSVVFAMHQGYQFLYFDTRLGEADPPVWYYSEGANAPEQKWQSFSGFFRHSIDDHLINS